MEFDMNLIRELRELAANGVAPSKLVLLIGNRLEIDGADFRLQAIAYFREAFHLSLADAKRIGAASAFPGGNREDGDVDQEVVSVIKNTEHLWRNQR